VNGREWSWPVPEIQVPKRSCPVCDTPFWMNPLNIVIFGLNEAGTADQGHEMICSDCIEWLEGFGPVPSGRTEAVCRGGAG